LFTNSEVRGVQARLTPCHERPGKDWLQTRPNLLLRFARLQMGTRCLQERPGFGDGWARRFTCYPEIISSLCPQESSQPAHDISTGRVSVWSKYGHAMLDQSQIEWVVKARNEGRSSVKPETNCFTAGHSRIGLRVVRGRTEGLLQNRLGCHLGEHRGGWFPDFSSD
jgi:hypothetical protein